MLLGTRDGFQRFLSSTFGHLVPVAIASHPVQDDSSGLALSDEETLALARRRARALEDQSGKPYDFHVGAEGGLHTLEVDGELTYFVRSWAVVRGLGDETWGASGSLQIPKSLIEGVEREDVASVLPATRRGGGMLSGLSYGRETRRTAVALAVFHALSTRFYGVLEGRRLPG